MLAKKKDQKNSSYYIFRVSNDFHIKDEANLDFQIRKIGFELIGVYYSKVNFI